MLQTVLSWGMVVFGLLLIYDFISLAIRVGVGRRYASAPLIGIALCAVYGAVLAGLLPAGPILAFLTGAALLFLVGFLAYLVGTGVCVLARPSADWSFVIVLGAALRRGRIPSPLLQSRLEVGRLWWQMPFGTPRVEARRLTAIASESVMPGSPALVLPKGAREAARNRRLVVCGGQGPDELVSEARAMRDFLVAKGVPDEYILLEDASRTTRENLENAKRIIAQGGQAGGKGPEAPVGQETGSGADGRRGCLVVTNDFHALRTWLWARRAQLDIVGVIGKPTRLYYLVGSLPRDYLALLKGYGRWVVLAAALLAVACLVL
ncbi:MAG: YdcF family protein [Eggerthellaceae bacterium]|jgi:uncharacterized SAM-binding protein YcdF (DUF218 family)